MFKKSCKILTLSVFFILVIIPWDIFFESKVSLTNMLQLPGAQHLFGTDNLGRDLLVRLSLAIREVVFPLWGVVFIATSLGFLFSILWRSNTSSSPITKLLYIFEANAALVLSIPLGITVFSFAVFFEVNGLFTVSCTLAVIFFLSSFLQVRDLFQSSSRLGHWRANEAMGGSLWLRQINYGVRGGWLSSIKSTFVSNMRLAIIIEASLSYLGFGVSEPDPSFGNMIASHYNMTLKGDFYVISIIVFTLLLCTHIPGLILEWRVKPRPLL